MFPQILTKTKNKNKRNVISLKKKNHKMSKRIEDVLKLNIDGYEKKLINIAKSIDFNKIQKKEDDDSNNIMKNPLLLSSSIRQVQKFLPNINVLLKTESHFNYNPSRQEHIKFEEQIKNEILMYTEEEKDLREKLSKVEKQLLNMENKIIDSKIEIQALKTINVSNVKSPLRKIIIKKMEDEFNKEEQQLILKYSTPIKKGYQSKKNLNKYRKIPSFNQVDFNMKLNLRLNEEEKINKEKEKNVEEKMEIIANDKDNVHMKLNDMKEKLKIVHNNKKFLIDQLYKHYLILLKEGKDSRKEGLSWIIMEIFYLNKNILSSNFPEYLDDECINYLFKMANISMKIIELEKKIKNKKDDLNKYIKSYNSKKYDNNLKFFYDHNEENINCYEYNKKQLSLLLSTFSTKFNSTNISKDNLFPIKKSNKEDNNSVTEKNINDNSKNISKNRFIFKTSKNLTNTNLDMDGSCSTTLFNKNEKKKKYKFNELQHFFDENNKSKLYKISDTLQSKEYLLFFNLSNELFSLKKEKDKLKLDEMNRIFKEFQRNNYKQRYQIDKKTVISALIGEDNLENELFKQERREKDYIYKMNKIQLFQNKNKRHKSFK